MAYSAMALLPVKWIGDYGCALTENPDQPQLASLRAELATAYERIAHLQAENERLRSECQRLIQLCQHTGGALAFTEYE